MLTLYDRDCKEMKATGNCEVLHALYQQQQHVFCKTLGNSFPFSLVWIFQSPLKHSCLYRFSLTLEGGTEEQEKERMMED